MYKKIFILISLVLLILVGCQDKDVVEEESGFSGKRNVKVVTAKIGEINEYLKYSGKVEAVTIANASPSMSGKIEKLFVKEGDSVEVDDLLVKLDQTQLEQTRIQFENAEKNYLRMQKLLESDAIDKQTFDEVETGYNIVKTSYEFMLDNIEMKAPISGIVTYIYKKEGEKFDSMMDPFLIRIVNSNKFKAKLQVSDKDINLLKQGQKAIITVDNTEDKFMGYVSYVSPEAEMMSGTFPIEISINNDSNLLRHNQFARIDLITKSVSNTIVIPQESILRSSYVYVADNGIAKEREVQLGIGNEYEIEILNGIADGEKVIISGNIGLQDGDKIEIKN
ncbi:MAG: efflux RND transporter periplasmic adaptor subunit [Candidatus Cloacimonetes bacterium]|jgi:RND family efflux transporter MFP subunit|nr:efflux RND transporter periplasmic adaptor subunit [Candidatus Cloacimonadota bacterium]MBT4333232.1 efflux RND transporter periplasmic adaptor subunit [Candidatus Cloacimonadota bacterium]MBT4575426.1 efflux RND transporter periplasmic adaptor subunit [Candidatus Cloacimonadota bacterium]